MSRCLCQRRHLYQRLSSSFSRDLQCRTRECVSLKTLIRVIIRVLLRDLHNTPAWQTGHVAQSLISADRISLPAGSAPTSVITAGGCMTGRTNRNHRPLRRAVQCLRYADYHYQSVGQQLQPSHNNNSVSDVHPLSHLIFICSKKFVHNNEHVGRSEGENDTYSLPYET